MDTKQYTGIWPKSLARFWTQRSTFFSARTLWWFLQMWRKTWYFWRPLQHPLPFYMWILNFCSLSIHVHESHVTLFEKNSSIIFYVVYTDEIKRTIFIFRRYFSTNIWLLPVKLSFTYIKLYNYIIRIILTFTPCFLLYLFYKNEYCLQ